jgi:hypothetical protein
MLGEPDVDVSFDSSPLVVNSRAGFLYFQGAPNFDDGDLDFWTGRLVIIY